MRENSKNNIKESNKNIELQIASNKKIRNLEDNESEEISNKFIEFYLDEIEEVNPSLKLTSP